MAPHPPDGDEAFGLYLTETSRGSWSEIGRSPVLHISELFDLFVKSECCRFKHW